jgi:hypothetical protein
METSSGLGGALPDFEVGPNAPRAEPDEIKISARADL